MKHLVAQCSPEEITIEEARELAAMGCDVVVNDNRIVRIYQ